MTMTTPTHQTPTPPTALVAFDSESGNTEEIALEIITALTEAGCKVTPHRINGKQPLEPQHFDLAFIGTYTWGYGAAPDTTTNFMNTHPLTCETGVFGTGETQWGEEYFCGAVDLLAGHYETRHPTIKLEHMPNSRQRAEIRQWTTQILNTLKGTPALA